MGIKSIKTFIIIVIILLMPLSGYAEHIGLKWGTFEFNRDYGFSTKDAFSFEVISDYQFKSNVKFKVDIDYYRLKGGSLNFLKQIDTYTHQVQIWSIVPSVRIDIVRGKVIRPFVGVGYGWFILKADFDLTRERDWFEKLFNPKTPFNAGKLDTVIFGGFEIILNPYVFIIAEFKQNFLKIDDVNSLNGQSLFVGVGFNINQKFK